MLTKPMKKPRPHIAVQPCNFGHLPADAAAILASPAMANYGPPTASDSPALAFLDHAQNCQNNRTALANTARKLFSGSSKASNYVTLLVGMPGLNRFYLPNALEDLSELSGRAAASAALTKDLGHKPIMLVLSYSPRPALMPEWHQDPGKTFLLCSEAVSSVAALEGAEVIKGKANADKATLYSPLRGMPIALNNMIHTKPYEVGDDDMDMDEDIPPPKSAMLVIYEHAKDMNKLEIYYAAAEPIANRVEALTGRRPRIWTP